MTQPRQANIAGELATAVPDVPPVWEAPFFALLSSEAQDEILRANGFSEIEITGRAHANTASTRA